MSRSTLRRIAYEAQPVSRGYGVAWRDWSTRGRVCYPVPLNIALGLLRQLWIWMAYTWPLESRIERRLERAGFDYAQGLFLPQLDRLREKLDRERLRRDEAEARLENFIRDLESWDGGRVNE